MFKKRQLAIFTFMAVLLPVLSQAQNNAGVESTLEIYNLDSGKRKTVYKEVSHFEAPNWSSDGQYFIINQNGHLFSVDIHGSSKQLIKSGELDKINNDHGISPDGQLLAISNNDPIAAADTGTSRIYVMPVQGGSPSLVTPLYPSYWHGWSPDSNSVVYTAMREGDYDIYRISITDGKEEKLTDSKGLDDGPEYSPDGRYIYYNSIRSGSMELWRMNSDGTDPMQLTDDEYSNWFPHPSPDNRNLVFLSYLEDQGDRHPAMKKVALRLFDLQSNSIRTLCSFTGGQGTINVPSWSPDGKAFAFVSYRPAEKK